MLKEAVHEALDERNAMNNMGDGEHYLHHIWIRDQITNQKDFKVAARESAIRWGVPTVIAGVAWALWEVAKMKLRGD